MNGRTPPMWVYPFGFQQLRLTVCFRPWGTHDDRGRVEMRASEEGMEARSMTVAARCAVSRTIDNEPTVLTRPIWPGRHRKPEPEPPRWRPFWRTLVVDGVTFVWHLAVALVVLTVFISILDYFNS